MMLYVSLYAFAITASVAYYRVGFNQNLKTLQKLVKINSKLETALEDIEKNNTKDGIWTSYWQYQKPRVDLIMEEEL